MGSGKASDIIKRAQRQEVIAPAQITKAPVGAARTSEFQRFVQDSTGKLLPIYGANFFANGQAYKPVLGTPVPSDYPLGPGDEVLIRGWGSVDIDYRAVIDRNGLINIPKVGSISLAGVRAADAEAVIRGAVGKLYRGFSLSVTLGQLRGITVYVVGQARFPGTYTLNSLSTVVTALFQSGGPNPNGSLRHVEVKRNGKQVADLDLYAFLAHGDKSSDIRLHDGDVIVIPPAYGFVALTGMVETPAIFELKGPTDTLQSLLDVAGGLPVVANPRRAYLERINSSRGQPRSIVAFSLDAAGLAQTLKDGDVVSIFPITSEFANAVTLHSGDDPALRVPFHQGMRVTDLIPDRAFLISRASLARQNSTSSKVSVGNKYDLLDWNYAVVDRLNRDQLTDYLVPFNLGQALSNPKGPDNLMLQPGDTVTVFSANDIRIPIAERQVFVRVEGEVRRPGVYQGKPDETLTSLIKQAGGLTPDAYLYGTEFDRETVRKAQQENLNKYIQKLQQEYLTSASRLSANISTTDPQAAALAQARVATENDSQRQFIQSLRQLKSNGRIALDLSPKDVSYDQMPAIRLHDGDRLVIPNRPDFVEIVGSVNSESAQLWHPGRTVSDYLNQAGVSKDADTDNIFVLRANGSVATKGDRWLSSIGSVEIMPGDVIVVPQKQDLESHWTIFTRNAKDVTQILANFGLGMAAFKTLGL